MDINELRRMLEMGEITQEQLSGLAMSGSAPQNALAQMLEPPMPTAPNVPDMPMNAMRNEQTGKMTYFAPQGQRGFQDTPYPENYQAPQAGLQPSRQPQNLGAEVEVAGRGKGRYSADGRNVVFADGSKHDLFPKASAARAKEAFERAKRESDLAHSQAGTAKTLEDIADTRSKREQSAQERQLLNSVGVPQSTLEKIHGKAPEGMRWTPGGQLVEIPGANNSAKSTEDEKRSAGLAIRMENGLKRMSASPEASRPEKWPELIRAATFGLVDAPANAATSTKRQIVESAQLDSLDAALTLATGAAYTKEQLKSLSRSYFPQIGDDDATIEDKRARFNDVITTSRIRAGRMAPKIDEALAKSATDAGASSSGSVRRYNPKTGRIE